MRLLLEEPRSEDAEYAMQTLAFTATLDHGCAVEWWREDDPDWVWAEASAVCAWEGDQPNRDGLEVVVRRKGVGFFRVGPSLLPDRRGFHVDRSGTGPFAEWSVAAAHSIPYHTGNRIRPGPGPLLVLIQPDGSRGMRYESPWFEDSVAFLRFLDEHADIPMVVMMAGSARPTHAQDVVVQSSKSMRWMERRERPEPLSHYAGIATVNALQGMRGFYEHVPVLCYGHTHYRHESVVYCLDDNPNLTVDVVDTLKRQRPTCLLDKAQDALVKLAQKNQWNQDNARLKFKHFFVEGDLL